MTQNNKPLMGTINSTYNRANEEGLGISKNLLRSLVKSNTLPHVKVGENQVLINYDVLRAFLFTGSPIVPPEQQPNQLPGQISPIPVAIGTKL